MDAQAKAAGQAPGRARTEDGPVPFGLYLHVPFCAHSCDFCAFYQRPPRRSSIERFLEGVERELASLRLLSRPIETVFWGGGTPTVLPARDLERLAAGVRGCWSGPVLEWTVEMAPSTVKEDKVEALLGAGVTRFSLGVQSFSDDRLEQLGRQHSRAQVDRALDQLRRLGADNLGIDLIFGVPGQTLEDWEWDLREAVARQPEHISTYCLTYEDDTRLLHRLQSGQVQAQTEEEERRFYEVTMDILPSEGLQQYEISNFARPGRECRHNLNTWHMAEWVGVGPSAASQSGGWRWANVPDLEQWLAGVESGVQARVERVRLTEEIQLGDCLVFGLRLNAGVDLGALKARFAMAASPALESLWEGLVETGHLWSPGAGRIALTREGRLVADRIGVMILDCLG